MPVVDMVEIVRLIFNIGGGGRGGKRIVGEEAIAAQVRLIRCT